MPAALPLLPTAAEACCLIASASASALTAEKPTPSPVSVSGLSFNQIGEALGGVDLVTSVQDRAEHCAALNEQDPPPTTYGRRT